MNKFLKIGIFAAAALLVFAALCGKKHIKK